MKEAAWFASSGRKMEADQVRAFEALSGRFGNRFRWHERSEDDVVASILPLHADDVRWASQIATRCALPIVPVGAGTAPDDGSGARRNAVQIRFDLMSGVSLSKDDEEWVDAEPGATWLQLDNELGRRGRGLAVYPTSAPRATVGGWLATDGIGVGSFEFGRLYENVISATVVGRGGEMREIGSDELGRYFMPMKAGNVVVGARLKTRRAATDRVFAAAFEKARDLAEAVGDLVASDAPLWHLAFVSPAMAAARGLRPHFLLFGVYPSHRDVEGWWELRRRVLEARGATELVVPETWRVWGERFFPVAPGQRTPDVAREFVPLADLPRVLEDANPTDALQGTVSRSGETLLLTLSAGVDTVGPG
jgi:FAD/FMN-containing dehydrogenase